MAIKWYPHHLGDYAKKTSGLSMLEHGAYRLLLDEYYNTGGALPNDHKYPARVCRAINPKERSAMTKILSLFFDLGEDGKHPSK